MHKRGDDQGSCKGGRVKIIRFLDPVPRLPVTILFRQVFGIIRFFFALFSCSALNTFIIKGVALQGICDPLHKSTLLFCGFWRGFCIPSSASLCSLLRSHSPSGIRTFSLGSRSISSWHRYAPGTCSGTIPLKCA